MSLYLKLGDRTVFSLVRERDLFDWVSVPDLMDLDPREAVKMFLEFRERLPPETVVSALEEAGANRRNLYVYLDALWDKDREASREFQGEMHHNLKLLQFPTYISSTVLNLEFKCPKNHRRISWVQ